MGGGTGGGAVGSSTEDEVGGIFSAGGKVIEGGSGISHGWAEGEAASGAGSLKPVFIRGSCGAVTAPAASVSSCNASPKG